MGFNMQTVLQSPNRAQTLKSELKSELKSMELQKTQELLVKQ